jgi:dTDP-4-amino-4,6-dideoxygalactose transaminase
LDAVQAALLRVKLGHLEHWTECRRRNADRYRAGLSGLAGLTLPLPETEGMRSVYHAFVVLHEERDALRAHLAKLGIETKIHYPVPIYRQPAARGSGCGDADFRECDRQAARILSLPIHQDLKATEVQAVIKAVRDFAG